MSECSAKYKDTKAAGSLNGANWNDFRKSQCDLAPAKRPTTATGSDATIIAANAVFPSACQKSQRLVLAGFSAEKFPKKSSLGRLWENFLYARVCAEDAHSSLMPVVATLNCAT